MMLARISGVIFDLYRAAREQQVETFQDIALELIKPVVQFDSALWLTGTLDLKSSDAVFHTQHLYKLPAQILSDWARIKDRAVFSRKVFSSPGITLNCNISNEFGPELKEHSHRYGIEHILATTMVDATSLLNELISIYRKDIGNPFTEDERLFVQNIVPHLAETWHINRLLHVLRADLPSHALQSCTGMADNKGILHLIEPSLARMLREEWPQWHGPQLPNALIDRIGKKENQFIGRKIVITTSSLHNHIVFRCRWKSIFDSLGQRKREVAVHFAKGFSHKEIAATLNLSPVTVRNYLYSVYAMLGISSKAELAYILKDFI